MGDVSAAIVIAATLGCGLLGAPVWTVGAAATWLLLLALAEVEASIETIPGPPGAGNGTFHHALARAVLVALAAYVAGVVIGTAASA
jgi:hypothetical protein